LKLEDHPDIADLRRALCDGYATRRHVDPAQLDFFLFLRALTYPGWIADRLDEPGAAERSARALRMALAHARQYLEHRGS